MHLYPGTDAARSADDRLRLARLDDGEATSAAGLGWARAKARVLVDRAGERVGVVAMASLATGPSSGCGTTIRDAQGRALARTCPSGATAPRRRGLTQAPG